MSYFSDFKVNGEKVYIYCKMTITNSSLIDKTFRLNAILKDDVKIGKIGKIGLLKSDNLKGYNEDLSSDIFTIEKNKYNIFSVVFVGEFAGTYEKHDRNLPEIVITTIK